MTRRRGWSGDRTGSPGGVVGVGRLGGVVGVAALGDGVTEDVGEGVELDLVGAPVVGLFEGGPGSPLTSMGTVNHASRSTAPATATPQAHDGSPP